MRPFGGLRQFHVGVQEEILRVALRSDETLRGIETRARAKGFKDSGIASYGVMRPFGGLRLALDDATECD